MTGIGGQGMVDGRQGFCRGGYTPRRDEKDAQTIEIKRDTSRPLCRKGCKLLKRKGLNEGGQNGWGRWGAVRCWRSANTRNYSMKFNRVSSTYLDIIRMEA